MSSSFIRSVIKKNVSSR